MYLMTCMNLLARPAQLEESYAVLAAAIPRVDGVNLASLALATVAGFEAVLPLAGAFQVLEGRLRPCRRSCD